MNKLPNAWILPGVPNLISNKSNPIKYYTYILKVIAESHKVKVSFLLEKIGTEDRVYLRQMFWYYMREIYNKKISYRWLGDILDCDHTTVIHGIKRFKDGLDSESIIPKKVISEYKTFNDDYFFTKQKI